MTIDEANEIVAALTYKPGWEIELVGGGVAGLALRLAMQAPDSTTTEHRPIAVRGDDVPLDPHNLQLFDEKRFVDWVFNQIMRLERHEAQEWFRLRGELVDDPHADDRT